MGHPTKLEPAIRTVVLAAAQRAGAVRPDVDAADVKALIIGCLARVDLDTDASVPERLLAVIRDGLRA